MNQLIKINANQLYDNLLSLNLSTLTGNIVFNLAGVSVKINTTDTVGITLQAWLKQYLINNKIYFNEPSNTQEFPDFFLDNINPNEHMLEIKAFNYKRTPAFDIANFESYCSSVKIKPYRLDADYLIFGYLMSQDGSIHIEKIWLKKIWEIAGTSARFPLKTQVKRDMIYNIRPNSDFKVGRSGPFTCKEHFLKAIYDTLVAYKGANFADEWLNVLSENYYNHYGQPLTLM
ncbi:NgoBV family restriction endonuclease [Clostridium botulinum]|uniref:NgoBV family restriction endonuclease n=1 Tax=Clostridium botulinum TaxID=1491 RepID=UPI003DA61DD7